MFHLAHWKGVLREQLSVKDNGLTVLEASNISALCRETGYKWRERIWSPTLTLLTFLQQVLSTAKSCRAAVSIALSELVASGYEGLLPSADDSPYCQARGRLPLAVVQKLQRQTTDALLASSREASRWCDRIVRIVDGSSVTMPDTPSLQAVFPQPEGQTAGCGFPTARLVALFDWWTGALIDVAVDRLRVHEIHLARRLWTHLNASDVLLGDRLFGSYADFALLGQRGVDLIARMHGRRKADYRKGRRLGPYDRVIRWERPLVCPRGMTVTEFVELPEYLDIRILRIFVEQNGFRSRVIDLTTTLLDPVKFPAEKIADLYRGRWLAETNLRSIKTHLGMETLRGKSPDIVRKEIAMNAIAYNLIRTLMYEAAIRYRCKLHRLSFTGTMHRISTWLPLLGVQESEASSILDALLESIAVDTVLDRPDRVEPRRVKRRPKGYSLLVRPRAEYKARKRDIDRDAR